MSDIFIATDRGKLEIEVEGNHLYVSSRCCGCGDEMTDLDVIRDLRDELDEYLRRNVREPDAGTARDPDSSSGDVPAAS